MSLKLDINQEVGAFMDMQLMCSLKAGVIWHELGARLHVWESTAGTDQNFHILGVYSFCIPSGRTLESPEGLSNYVDVPQASKMLWSRCIPMNKSSKMMTF